MNNLPLLHAVWEKDGRLLLWLESQAEGERRPNPTSDGELGHPYALPASSIKEVLQSIELESGEERSLLLWFPSELSGPIRSNDPEREIPELQLQQWRLPAISLPQSELVPFLSSSPDELRPHVAIGSSLAFIRIAFRYGLDLLARGHVVPQLKAVAGAGESLWAPSFPDEHEQRRLSQLIANIPGHLVSLPESPDIEPSRLIIGFLENIVDTIARNHLARLPLASALEGIRLPGKSLLGKRWFESLFRADRAFEGDHSEMRTLERSLQIWRTPLAAQKQRHVLRLAIELTPPRPEHVSLSDLQEPDPDSWQLEVYVQDAAQPHRLISSTNLAAGQLGFLRGSGHTISDLEEIFLGNLVPLALLFPPLGRILRDHRFSPIVLSHDETFRFLREIVPLMKNHDVGLLLPDFQGSRKQKLGLRLHLTSADGTSGESHNVPSSIGLQQLIGFSWSIALGDQEISAEQFEALVAEHGPLFSYGGEWFDIADETLKNTLHFLKEQKLRASMSTQELLQLGLGNGLPDSVLPLLGYTTSGWISRLLDNADGRPMQLAQPESFQGQLRPYQLDGMSWLAFLGRHGVGACLADDMGLGKTIQLLAFLLHEQNERPADAPPPQPTLLVVPMSILHNWSYEAKRFAPSLSVLVHHGSTRLSGMAFIEAAREVDLVVTTYSLAFRDERTLSSVAWGRIALDEAQNIKNFASKQTQAVRRIALRNLAPTPTTVSCQRIALTGTPLENNLDELWSIFDFLNPGLLGTLGDFRRRYTNATDRIERERATGALSRLLKPFTLRRLKSDPTIVEELPDKIEMEEFTILTKEQAALYQAVLNELFPKVNAAEGIKRKGLVLSLITSLKQICNHPALYLKERHLDSSRSGKLLRLEELVEEMLAEGDKTLIFTQYAQMGHLLQPWLAQRFNREVLFFHGGQSKDARENIVKNFQSKEGPPILILSLKAGGLGLNLTEANQVVHFDQWWNPAVEQQATDRAYRIGQMRRVQVRKLRCKGTLEEKIAQLVERKRELFSQVVGASSPTLTEVSNEELHSLLSLTREDGDI